MSIYRRAGKVLALAICFTMVFGSTAFAAKDKTYLAMGDDLSKSETKTVLQLFGVSKDDCEVLYITNKDEHKYLDDYVDSAKIGTKALSCVMINENDGDEIDVETYNINYCTEDMYENALQTAGVTGAEVVVAGPYPISGTAALVGTIKAYEEMTGTRVSDKVVEAAVEELTTTGDIGEDVGNMDAVADIIDEVKEAVAENPDMSDSDLIQKIKDIAAKYGISLSEENIQKIKDMIQGFKGLDIDWGGFFNKVKEVGGEGLDKAKEMGFFDKIKAWIMSLID